KRSSTANLKCQPKEEKRKCGMTSDRKIKANRKNARASTGPKTARGRTRTAPNARRHGLSLPKACARIARPGATAETQECARRLAEARIDLRRVRYRAPSIALPCVEQCLLCAAALMHSLLRWTARAISMEAPIKPTPEGRRNSQQSWRESLNG